MCTSLQTRPMSDLLYLFTDYMFYKLHLSAFLKNKMNECLIVICCSHHMRVGYLSWSCFYPKSIQCPRQKYAS